MRTFLSTNKVVIAFQKKNLMCTITSETPKTEKQCKNSHVQRKKSVALGISFFFQDECRKDKTQNSDHHQRTRRFLLAAFRYFFGPTGTPPQFLRLASPLALSSTPGPQTFFSSHFTGSGNFSSLSFDVTLHIPEFCWDLLNSISFDQRLLEF